MGQQVAAHSAPLGQSGEALVIATRSSAWSQQLQFLSTTILARVHALPAPPGGTPITRLAFRSGRFRGQESRQGARFAGSPAARPRRHGEVPEPAADIWDAAERVRRRVNRLQHAAQSRCSECGLVLRPAVGGGGEPPSGEHGTRCAPCANGAYGARLIAVQRALYVTPWLGYAELREQIPALQRDDYERARRHLLVRWWGILERARRAGHLSRAGFERDIASSYVLLQSGHRPDRMTPAVARNLLGAELEALLRGPAVKS